MTEPKWAIIKYTNPKDVFESQIADGGSIKDDLCWGDKDYTCPVCGKPIETLDFLWTVSEGIAAAEDILIHKECVAEYRRTQFSFWFRGN